MGTLVIRELDDNVKAQLRRRAADHGRSMEAEARAILAAAVGSNRPASRLGSFIHEHFAGVGGVELSAPSRGEPARAADLTP